MQCNNPVAYTTQQQPMSRRILVNHVAAWRGFADPDSTGVLQTHEDEQTVVNALEACGKANRALRRKRGIAVSCNAVSTIDSGHPLDADVGVPSKIGGADVTEMIDGRVSVVRSFATDDSVERTLGAFIATVAAHTESNQGTTHGVCMRSDDFVVIVQLVAEGGTWKCAAHLAKPWVRAQNDVQLPASVVTNPLFTCQVGMDTDSVSRLLKVLIDVFAYGVSPSVYQSRAVPLPQQYAALINKGHARLVHATWFHSVSFVSGAPSEPVVVPPLTPPDRRLTDLGAMTKLQRYVMGISMAHFAAKITIANRGGQVSFLGTNTREDNRLVPVSQTWALFREGVPGNARALLNTATAVPVLVECGLHRRAPGRDVAIALARFIVTNAVRAVLRTSESMIQLPGNLLSTVMTPDIREELSTILEIGAHEEERLAFGDIVDLVHVMLYENIVRMAVPRLSTTTRRAADLVLRAFNVATIEIPYTRTSMCMGGNIYTNKGVADDAARTLFQSANGSRTSILAAHILNIYAFADMFRANFGGTDEPVAHPIGGFDFSSVDLELVGNLPDWLLEWFEGVVSPKTTLNLLLRSGDRVFDAQLIPGQIRITDNTAGVCVEIPVPRFEHPLAVPSPCVDGHALMALVRALDALCIDTLVVPTHAMAFSVTRRAFIGTEQEIKGTTIIRQLNRRLGPEGSTVMYVHPIVIRMVLAITKMCQPEFNLASCERMTHADGGPGGARFLLFPRSTVRTDSDLDRPDKAGRPWFDCKEFMSLYENMVFRETYADGERELRAANRQWNRRRRAGAGAGDPGSPDSSDDDGARSVDGDVGEEDRGVFDGEDSDPWTEELEELCAAAVSNWKGGTAIQEVFGELGDIVKEAHASLTQVLRDLREAEAALKAKRLGAVVTSDALRSAMKEVAECVFKDTSRERDHQNALAAIDGRPLRRPRAVDMAARWREVVAKAPTGNPILDFLTNAIGTKLAPDALVGDTQVGLVSALSDAWTGHLSEIEACQPGDFIQIGGRFEAAEQAVVICIAGMSQHLQQKVRDVRRIEEGIQDLLSEVRVPLAALLWGPEFLAPTVADEATYLEFRDLVATLVDAAKAVQANLRYYLRCVLHRLQVVVFVCGEGLDLAVRTAYQRTLEELESDAAPASRHLLEQLRSEEWRANHPFIVVDDDGLQASERDALTEFLVALRDGVVQCRKQFVATIPDHAPVSLVAMQLARNGDQRFRFRMDEVFAAAAYEQVDPYVFTRDFADVVRFAMASDGVSALAQLDALAASRRLHMAVHLGDGMGAGVMALTDTGTVLSVAHRARLLCLRGANGAVDGAPGRQRWAASCMHRGTQPDGSAGPTCTIVVTFEMATTGPVFHGHGATLQAKATTFLTRHCVRVVETCQHRVDKLLCRAVQGEFWAAWHSAGAMLAELVADNRFPVGMFRLCGLALCLVDPDTGYVATACSRGMTTHVRCVDRPVSTCILFSHVVEPLAGMQFVLSRHATVHICADKLPQGGGAAASGSPMASAEFVHALRPGTACVGTMQLTAGHTTRLFAMDTFLSKERKVCVARWAALKKRPAGVGPALQVNLARAVTFASEDDDDDRLFTSKHAVLMDAAGYALGDSRMTNAGAATLLGKVAFPLPIFDQPRYLLDYEFEPVRSGGKTFFDVTDPDFAVNWPKRIRAVVCPVLGMGPSTVEAWHIALLMTLELSLAAPYAFKGAHTWVGNPGTSLPDRLHTAVGEVDPFVFLVPYGATYILPTAAVQRILGNTRIRHVLTVLLAPGRKKLKNAFRVCITYIDTVARAAGTPLLVGNALRNTSGLVQDAAAFAV